MVRKQLLVKLPSLLLCTLALALVPAAASAATLCMGTTSCSDPADVFPMTANGLQDALSKAASQNGTDRIEIGAGTIEIDSTMVTTTPSASNIVSIEGVGNGNSTIHVSVPSGIGMSFNFSSAPTSGMSNLNITMDGVQTSSRYALAMRGGSLTGLKFDVTGNGGFGSYALSSVGPLSVNWPEIKVRGDGATAINANGPMTFFRPVIEQVGTPTSQTRGFTMSGSGTVSFTNAIFRGLGTAAILDSGQVDFRDSLIDLGSRAGADGVMVANYNNSASTIGGSIDGVSIVGSGTGQTGMGVFAQTTNALGEIGTGTIKNSLFMLTGAGSNDTECHESGFGVATITTNWSVTKSTAPLLSGPCDSTGADNGVSDALSAGDLFVDALAGDYRLAPGAAVIDQGDPATPLAGRVDVTASNRFVNGTTLALGTIDPGAYEYQNYAPSTPSFTALPTPGVVGQQIQFEASGSTDPNGDTVTYHWSFGDGEEAVGASATHAYAQPGNYAVKVQARDADLATDSLAATVTITDAPVTQLPGTPILPATITLGKPTGSFKAAKKATGFKLGSVKSKPRIPLTTSFTGPIKLTLKRVKGGFAQGTKCVKAKPKSGKPKKCPLALKGSQTVIITSAVPSFLEFGGKWGRSKLAPGKYELTATSSLSKDAPRSILNVIR